MGCRPAARVRAAEERADRREPRWSQVFGVLVWTKLLKQSEDEDEEEEEVGHVHHLSAR